MSEYNPESTFKAGGDASATATATQEAFTGGAQSQTTDPFGVGQPAIQTDEDAVLQSQGVKAGALGGGGGVDNVFTNIVV